MCVCVGSVRQHMSLPPPLKPPISLSHTLSIPSSPPPPPPPLRQGAFRQAAMAGRTLIGRPDAMGEQVQRIFA